MPTEVAEPELAIPLLHAQIAARQQLRQPAPRGAVLRISQHIRRAVRKHLDLEALKAKIELNQLANMRFIFDDENP